MISEESYKDYCNTAELLCLDNINPRKRADAEFPATRLSTRGALAFNISG